MQRLRDLLVPRSSAPSQPESSADTCDEQSSDSDLALIFERSCHRQPEPQSCSEAGIEPVEISTDSDATITEEPVLGQNTMDLTTAAPEEMIQEAIRRFGDAVREQFKLED